MKKINLNSIIFNEQISKVDILTHVTQEQIYSHYIGEEITSGIKINSPLRDDNVPSFGFYYRRDNSGVLMFNDLATKDCGDCFIFVGKYYDLKFKDVLYKIAFDFGLSDMEISAEKQQFIQAKRVVQKEVVKIGIKSRKWKLVDKEYWSSFGISKETLIKYNVVPITHVFYNENPVKTDLLAYAYIEYKDNEISYKIYQPLSKDYKWMNNANYTVHQGYTQLPEKGDLLIITKSLKDVMSIHDVMGITAIGLQSESVMMKDTVMNEYKSRFKQVVCLFDNDKAGKKLSKEFTEEYGIVHFFMPEYPNVTDFSDLVKFVGIKKTIKEFNKILKYEK